MVPLRLMPLKLGFDNHKVFMDEHDNKGAPQAELFYRYLDIDLQL